MKKFLSLILAILMIVSTVPMAFATGETTTPEAKMALFDAVIELETKVYSSYAYSGSKAALLSLKEAVWNISAEFRYYTVEVYYANFFEDSPWEVEVNHEYLDSNPDAVEKMTQVAVNANNEINKFLEDNNAYIVVDASAFVEAMYNVVLNYSYEEQREIMMMVGGDINIAENKANNAYESWFNGISYCIDIPMDYFENGAITQTNLDSATAYFIKYYRCLYNCLCGTHNLTAATDNLDETHTGICDFCCQTVTVSHNYIYGVCNLCGAVDNCYFGNHTLNEATDNLDGTHTGACDSCGQFVTSTHDYIGGICGLCGAVDNCYFGNHTLNEATDNLDGTHTGTCDSCGQTVTLDHDYTDGVCGLCGAVDESFVEDSTEEDDEFLEKLEKFVRKYIKDEELAKQIVDAFKALYNLIKNSLKG